MKISIRPIKTDVVCPPQDDLLKHIRQSKLTLKEGDIVVVTSKVVGIWEGRTLPIDSIKKDDLVKQESKLWIPRKNVKGRRVMHTITQGVLIASAGIDESNGNGWYILYPKNPEKSARRLLSFFRKEYGVKNIAVVMTDSRSTPLRRGVSGFSLAHAGLRPLYDYRGTTDLFGRMLHFSQSNVPDALASIAVLAMGEGAEQTPLAVISGTPYVSRRSPKKNKIFNSFDVSLKDDLFSVFLSKAPWRKGRGR